MELGEKIRKLGSFTIFSMIFSNTALTASITSNSSPCQRIVDNSGDDWTIAILNPGEYCIDQNLYQYEPIVRLPHQAVPKAPLLVIRNSFVLADINNHHLKSLVIHRAGVWIHAQKPSPLTRITIRNGRVTTTSGPTVFAVDAFEELSDTRFGQNFPITSSQGHASRYRPTEFVLENLTLEGDKHVIIMQGMKNIIRHCKIIGGNGTVNVFGPQLIFEDNEIILHANAHTSASDDAPVALYLEDAADSIVRNNRIVIKGRTAGSEAIVLKNSPNVTLSGNTITGADAVYKLLDENSSVIATDNMMQR